VGFSKTLVWASANSSTLVLGNVTVDTPCYYLLPCLTSYYANGTKTHIRLCVPRLYTVHQAEVIQLPFGLTRKISCTVVRYKYASHIASQCRRQGYRLWEWEETPSVCDPTILSIMKFITSLSPRAFVLIEERV
jgi:hypothetical protein